MRTRSLVMAAVLAVSVSGGAPAFAHGRHGDERHHRAGHLSFELSGREVPGGGDPAGRAVVGLRLDPEAETVCLRANWRDVAGDVTAIHIHRAPAGENGPHHIDLLDDEHLAGRANRVEFCVRVGGGDGKTHAHAADGHGSGGHGAAAAPSDRIQEIVDNPGAFYLNVHSTEFPKGALRGQLDG